MAAKTKRWTLGELHRLPDDGNKYEVVRGELFVTPAPAAEHEEIAVVFRRLLEPYVERESLGRVYTPRAVIQLRHSEVEPDIMVRRRAPGPPPTWRKAPVPMLVVEILSDSTRRRDHLQKRQLYLDIGVPEYWIVDGEERTIRVVRPDEPDVEHSDSLTWHPEGAAEPLALDVRAMFREALGV
jgi:Uma2 family endonuclease